ncbi:MAG: hypothetical protein ACK40A_18025 [Pannonibacter indicus]
MKIVKFFLTLIIGLAVIGGYLGFRWHQYVTNTDSPYDEIGITLNSYMPAPVNQWGCNQLKVNFGNQLPPYGCQAATAQQWK